LAKNTERGGAAIFRLPFFVRSNFWVREEVSVMGRTLNVVCGAPWPAGPLSNLARTPFRLQFDGEWVEVISAEGPIQAVKFPRDDPRRGATLTVAGEVAKKMSRVAARTYGQRFIWWWKERGVWEELPYGSAAHHTVLAGFIRAKFVRGTGNAEARQALLATVGLELTHDLSHPEGKNTSLPAAVFVRILTEIRAEIVAGRF
jgi:hypothetical protein